MLPRACPAEPRMLTCSKNIGALRNQEEESWGLERSIWRECGKWGPSSRAGGSALVHASVLEHHTEVATAGTGGKRELYFSREYSTSCAQERSRGVDGMVWA